MGAPSAPTKKAIHHRNRAYDNFATSFAPQFTPDELVQAVPEFQDGVEKVERLVWLWLVNCGGASLGTVGVAEQTVKTFEGVVEVVDWLHKSCALVGFSSLKYAFTAHSALHEAPHPSTSRGALYVEFARPSCVPPILASLEPNWPQPEVQENVKRWPSIGLMLIEEFVTEEEEQAIMRSIREDDKWSDNLAKRQSMHAGPIFDYTTFRSSSTLSAPIPPYLSPLLPRLPRLANEPVADQLTVQFYPAGTGIPPHVDTHSAFGESLYSLSLQSAVEMVLVPCGPQEARRLRLPKRSLLAPSDATDSRSPSPDTQRAASPAPSVSTTPQVTSGPSYPLQLPPRSLLILTGPSRYAYTHGIASRKADQVGRRVVERDRGGRYSITFRSVRKEDERGCECAWPEFCDWRIRLETGAEQ